jgi:hypothetical protein
VVQSLIHIVPTVFDGVKIRAIPWPVNDVEGLVRQVLFDALAGATGRAIVEEVRGLLRRHERYQVVLQHLLISFTVHGGVFGQKEEAPIAPMAPSTGKAAPDHHGGGMLHSLHRVPAVEAVGARRPPHQAPLSP